ncbi:MAG: peptide ABC transporter substrate-binding protein [Bdellovibrionales bacterium RIFOXYD12_FULL_39_22]|nr:MAG: peptide ABC transporter substrate-binding protein [Bdellovibrionales bacterium RIFOXYB1_FULL_39_21]OFZ42654.1 MAG: peptide ABC transporter substrate-binding protein [Bdellovibrionales bacterium RIFOXYC12_FULL_39_17]OFZ47078.1 MAG: peptide ABC transporter substrate-binding protein [Bdellovibrionales bacterium RIFOXYC1_FULL_39_130]OFZ71433.1 MAG: peptide ABC transporter substrate-binding protein [Bdellovibrionales bacterium RIFOXYC2_FULL_39_8]OFZ75326.1 MAG: peptide ABC transporter substr
MRQKLLKNSATYFFAVLMLNFIAVGDSFGAKTFIYCSEGSPTNFNPQLTTDGTSANAAGSTIYDTLIKFKYGTTEIEPGLAESWIVSKDSKLFTFKLRKGVKFHSNEFFKPSREFNADDVLFSFLRQMDKSHPYHKVGGATYDYWEAMEMGKIIKSIKKIDDYTVEFALSQAEAPFLANLAMNFASILSAEYADKLAKSSQMEKIDNYPIGTGPFIFNSYQKDTIIRFSKNPDYFLGAPKIDKLVFSITPDASVRYQKLKTGECNFVTEPAPQNLADMQKNSNILLMQKAGLNVGYLALNTSKKPFDNLQVRRAINHALNKEAYIKAIYLGNALMAKNPIPPTMWSYNDGVVDYDYNPALAKKLISEAKLPKDLVLELWTLPVSRPYNPNGKKMGEMMQADLAAAGLNVKLVSYDWGTYLAKSKEGKHDLIQFGWTGDNGDPDNFLNVLLGCAAVEAGSNYARWCHDEFDGLLQKAKQTTVPKERIELYRRAQVLLKKEAPWATIAHSVVYRAMGTNVIGYQMDPLGHDIFTTVDLK